MPDKIYQYVQKLSGETGPVKGTADSLRSQVVALDPPAKPGAESNVFSRQVNDLPYR